MIKKDGNKWKVTSKSGKVLGIHSTKKEALKQLRAIEYKKEAY